MKIPDDSNRYKNKKVLNWGMRITRADKILIACLFALNIFLFAQVDLGNRAGNWVVIEVDHKEVKRLPLSENRVVHVTGPIGETEVEIIDGKGRRLTSLWATAWILWTFYR